MSVILETEKRRCGSGDNVHVFGLLKREIYTAIMPNSKENTLITIIKGKVMQNNIDG